MLPEIAYLLIFRRMGRPNIYVVPDRKLRFYRDVYSPAPGNPGGFNSLLDNRRRVTGMNEIRSHSRRLTGALILGRAEPSPCGCG